MGKVFMFVTIIATVMALLGAAGVPNTATGHLLSAIAYGHFGDLVTADFYANLFSTTAGKLALFAAAGTAITIGLFFSQGLVATAVAGIAFGIAGWVVGDMVTIINVFEAQLTGTEYGWIVTGMQIIIGVYVIGFLVAIVEWWQGSD